MNKFTGFRIISILLSVSFLVACSKSPLPSTNEASTGGNEAVVTTQQTAASDANNASTGACTILPQADVEKALGITVDSAVESGLGGVCTYSTTDLSIDLTLSHTGGIKYMQDALVKLGDLALVIPGLGDQAFINTNVNTLSVLKGDAVYLISVSDSSYKLTSEELQAKERFIAEQLINDLS